MNETPNPKPEVLMTKPYTKEAGGLLRSLAMAQIAQEGTLPHPAGIWGCGYFEQVISKGPAIWARHVGPLHLQ